jgi:hypothetical protein
MTTKERRAKFNRKPKKKLSIRNELVATYGRSCWLCGRGIAYEAVLSIDHVHPLSKGGSSKIHNLRLAHESCNRKRGNGPVPVLMLQSDMRMRRTISKGAELERAPVVEVPRTVDRGQRKFLQSALFSAMRNAMLRIAPIVRRSAPISRAEA